MERARSATSHAAGESDETALEREGLRQMADLLAKILDTAIPSPGRRYESASIR